MNKLLTIMALIIMIASGYWMSSDKFLSFGSVVLNSNWGSAGLAFGACLMIISIKQKKGSKND
jgi:hypothetical protein